ncbi:hypothetical protein ISN45_At03g029970 [Arabidopsis thaliana x Arabidopsis arenosa]|uniref:Uncharacterized protein n=1 Tax=Arabidopsis thaliana x Arabidopsis arenosa TaxID=1240361 RepID=A0A8T2F5I8_9BRAS|nr:hypothetical protein ISN45_At03g029970 [Arabidopsis thaliana x Arabidopsis arenosa]
MEKNIKDIQGSSRALVLEKVRPGFVQASAGPVSKELQHLQGQDIKLSMESYSPRLGRAKQFHKYFI